MTASQILVVEDERLLAMAIKSELERFGYRVSGIASSAREAVDKALATKPDLVLMDVHLKGGDDGIETAAKIHTQLGTPVVFLSAYSDPESVARASATEAFGYLVKPYEERELQTTIEMALAKHRAELRLEETDRWLTAIHNGISESVVTVDAKSRVRYMNLAAEALTGWRKEEAAGLPVSQVCEFAGTGLKVVNDLLNTAANESRVVNLPAATWAILRGNQAIPIEGTVSPIFDSRGNRLGSVLVVRDIRTRLEAEELRRLSEERRQREQKLDAVARMAGGIADRLNDLLTAVLGNTSLALSSLPADAENRELLTGIELAAQHAAALVQRLSLFSTLSGRRSPNMQSVNLAILLPDCIGQIKSRLGPRITVSEHLFDGLWSILGDELLLGQALLELALNAQQAMPASGGQLQIDARNVTVRDEDLAGNPEGHAGEFVRIRVQDSGRGIKPTVRAHLFEPYLMKGSGARAGLGLALVYSAVKQLQGWIDYASEVNHGTQFDLYFPRYGMTIGRGEPIDLDKPPGSAPVILLCDGDPLVREMGRKVLESQGYEVVVAEDGVEAISLYRQSPKRIELAILDLNLSRLSAYSVLERLVECDPGVRVLFSGGFFAEDLTAEEGHILGVVSKPYRRDELVSMVQRALNTERRTKISEGSN